MSQLLECQKMEQVYTSSCGNYCWFWNAGFEEWVLINLYRFKMLSTGGGAAFKGIAAFRVKQLKQKGI